MHHAFLDRYSDGTSPVHRFDARVKAAVALVAVLCIATLPLGHPGALALFGLLLLAFWIAARLPLVFLLKRMAVLAPFIFLLSLSAAWTGHRAPGSSAVLMAAQIALRAAAAIAALSLLTSTTRFPTLLAVLQWYRVPSVIVALLAFLYRFIYILVDELERLDVGRKSRELSRGLVLAWRGRAWMLGSFLVRSLERSERVYQAMLARGYAGRAIAPDFGSRCGAREAWVGAAAIAAFLLVRAGAFA